MTDLELTASPVIYDENYSVELMIGADRFLLDPDQARDLAEALENAAVEPDRCEHQTYRAHRDFGPAEHCPNLATEDGYCPAHVDAA